MATKKRKNPTKTISFTEKDQDVLDYLLKQDNASKYMVRLVRQDMANQRAVTERKYLNWPWDFHSWEREVN